MNFFTGGLTYQIEHHLFPSYNYIYYPQLSVVVKKHAAKAGHTNGLNGLPIFFISIPSISSSKNYLKIT
jgi:hypothetical protein